MIYNPAKIEIGRIIPDKPLLNKPDIPEANAPGAPKSDVIAFPKLLKKILSALIACVSHYNIYYT